jgi:starvation-inducible DNA-binding protein
MRNDSRSKHDHRHQHRRAEYGRVRSQCPPRRPLQAVLVDLIALHLQGKQPHWNVVGHNVRDLHLQLDEIVDAAREASDTTAERMRGPRRHRARPGRHRRRHRQTAPPTGELVTSEVVDRITDGLRSAVHTIRTVHHKVDAEDPSTSDLLHAITDTLEKHAWMLSAENRSPQPATR